MKLRTRLLLTLIAIAVLLAGPAIYALSRLAQLREIAGEQRTRHAYALIQHGELTTKVAELDRFERGYIISGDEAQRAGMESALREARMRLDTLKTIGYSEAIRPAEQSLTNLEEATGNVIRFMETGRAQEATAYFENVKPLLSQSQNSLRMIAGAIDERSAQDMLVAQSISTSAASNTLVVLLICLVAATALGLYTGSTFTRPILRLRRNMAAVAEGDFDLPEDQDFKRADEIGDLARSFNWMTERLQKLDQMKAEFISIATHELKTPINVINGYTELLEEGIYGEPTEKQLEALHTIEEQTRVLTNLVNQLLDISRLEAGGLQLEMKEVVLQDLFARVERSFAVLARRKNIVFNVEVDPNVPVAIPGDSDRLADQVLGNLISNALKFTQEGGSIDVRAWQAGDQLRIEVRDTGEGISEEQLPYIFDKYFQVGQQARTKGAGLGLAIAREVVEAHGGSISVDSERGRGTTFTMEIPLRRFRNRQERGSVVEKTA
ncbi:MAG TPA: HAMP domain-containing sensor histidine kinase [Longimicrobiales bacterium]